MAKPSTRRLYRKSSSKSAFLGSCRDNCPLRSIRFRKIIQVLRACSSCRRTKSQICVALRGEPKQWQMPTGKL